LTQPPRHTRRRSLYAAWTAVVICAGLASRSDFVGLPPFLAKYAGDALWALMVFLGIALLVPTRSTATVAGLALAVSCAVEASQLYHAPWLDAIRRTTLGHLVLGDTFAWGDIGAYLVGITVGAVAEWGSGRVNWRRPYCRLPDRQKELPMNDDPFDLNRFVAAQEDDYEQALAEIRSGRKRTHWMWYVFPQFAGLGSSSMAERYAIKSAEEAKACLAHPILGPRLVECAEAVLGVEGRSVHEIFGSPDDLKLRSSATLFAAVSPSGSAFERVLDKYYGGEADEKTIHLMGKT
jgi:uncharacterized protein (DUF1810 family)